MTELAVEPEVRITAHIFERAYGSAPAGVWRAPGALTLLGGQPALAVALPWGVIVALAATGDGSAAFYSMNHHTDAFSVGHGRLPSALASGGVPEWARAAAEALIAYDGPGTRVMVNRELPAQMGLLTGDETACAVELGLRELHEADGRPCDASPRPSPRPSISASYATALNARAKHALLLSDKIEHLPFDLVTAGLRLLIMDVGCAGAPSPRQDGSLAERAAAALRAGDIAGLGPLLTEAHVRGEPLLDLALDAAHDAGALGGLAIGRCGVALVPMAGVPGIRAAVTSRLAGRARRPPRFLTAVPAERPTTRAL
ncbi:hypothetical protein ACGFNU_28125 [Spirillospora sp. NPDC048911]|uniref:hypothetical protein n=1 Tax=Spirillospora sp. NPDC048911 TaxID=3364527 RepID=UPI003713F6B3